MPARIAQSQSTIATVTTRVHAAVRGQKQAVLGTRGHHGPLDFLVTHPVLYFDRSPSRSSVTQPQCTIIAPTPRIRRFDVVDAQGVVAATGHLLHPTFDHDKHIDGPGLDLNRFVRGRFVGGGGGSAGGGGGGGGGGG